jgi:hypothetical protein
VGAGHPRSGRARPQLPGKAPDPGAAWQQDEVREAGIRVVSTRRRSFDALFACSGFDNFIPSASSSLSRLHLQFFFFSINHHLRVPT